MQNLRSLVKSKNITFGSYFDSGSLDSYHKENNRIMYNSKVKNPHTNNVVFVPMSTDGTNFATTRHHTCKETFINYIREVFRGAGAKFKDVPFLVIMHDEYADNAIEFIRKFESQILKITKPSLFESIDKYEGKGVIKITPARRWARTPQSFYILASLFRLAHLYDKTLDAKANIKAIYDNGYGADYFPMNDQSTIMQFRNSYPLFEKIFEVGFENVFKSSKFFENAWCIGKADPKFSTMAGMGIQSLGITKFNREIGGNFSRESEIIKFAGLTDEIADFFFGPDKNKPATQAAQ